MRLRRKIAGSAQKPRLSVCFTEKHIYVQLIDDEAGHTIVSASSLDPEFKEAGGKTNLKGAEVLGRLAAEKAAQAGIKEVVFDRGGFRYHGRVKTLAEAARSAGLKF